MGTLSPVHWALVALVVLLLFGPKTLAKIGKQVGQGVRSVNKVKQGLTVDPLSVLTSPAPRPASKRDPAPERGPQGAGEPAEPAASAEAGVSPAAGAEPGPAAADKA
jgi:TatA/E family protein of Tat protein translocase